MSYPAQCPSCNADLMGESIPPEHWETFGATRFSRVIGISDGDSVGWWKCPDCKARWERAGWTAEQARRNMERMGNGHG